LGSSSTTFPRISRSSSFAIGDQFPVFLFVIAARHSHAAAKMEGFRTGSSA